MHVRQTSRARVVGFSPHRVSRCFLESRARGRASIAVGQRRVRVHVSANAVRVVVVERGGAEARGTVERGRAGRTSARGTTRGEAKDDERQGELDEDAQGGERGVESRGRRERARFGEGGDRGGRGRVRSVGHGWKGGERARGAR